MLSNKQNDLSHFEAEKRDRCLNTAAQMVLFVILAYFGYVEFEAAMCVGCFNIGVIIASYLTTPKLPIFSHFANLGASIVSCFILCFSPGESGLARLISLINAVATSFEQRKVFFRILYTTVSIVSWYLASKYNSSHSLNDCSGQRPQEETGIFLLSIFFLTLISSSHSDLERKALNEAEDALSKLQAINSKYEQANEQLKLLLEEKDNFILLFSHETRNPLNILMGNLSILLTEVQIPRLRMRIIRAKFCAELLLHNLNNILDTGKLTNKGTLEISPVSVQLSQYLHSIWDIAKMMLMKKQLKPMLIIPQSLPPFVTLDAQRISQIIMNLISNSVKFTASGSVCLTVHYLKKKEIHEQDFFPSSLFGNKLTRDYSAEIPERQTNQSNRDFQSAANESKSHIEEEYLETHSVARKYYASELTREFRTQSLDQCESRNNSDGNENENGFLKFEVIDTGCGIKEEDLDKLFQKFSQVNSEASQRQIGSGLGLWISKTLAEIMGGGIRVYSKPNIGTSFVFIIKADLATLPSEVLARPRPLTFKHEKELHQRILLADDDPYNIETHSLMLKSLGFTEIDTESDGFALVNAFKSKPEYYYELIITDISMPKLNGIEAIKLIRQYERSAGRRDKIKVAFITGNSSNKEKQLCESAEVGALYYLTKPLTIATLKGALQALGLLKNKVFKRKVLAADDREVMKIISKRKPLVLCVDDDILNLEIFEDLLTDLGAKPIRATSGEEAVAVFASKLANGPSIDLVLIDCLMSSSDGWIASAEMKRLAVNIPVIGVTGGDIKRYEEKFKAAKMNEIIRKPVQREELEQLLKNYLFL